MTAETYRLTLRRCRFLRLCLVPFFDPEADFLYSSELPGSDLLLCDPIRPCWALHCKPIGSSRVPFGGMHSAD